MMRRTSVTPTSISDLRSLAATTARRRSRDTLRPQRHRRRRRHVAQGARTRRQLPRPRGPGDGQVRTRHATASTCCRSTPSRARPAAIPEILTLIGRPFDQRHRLRGRRLGLLRGLEVPAFRPGQPRRPRARCWNWRPSTAGDLTTRNKRDPLDFVLWQPSLDDEPAWESRWGPAVRAGTSSVRRWRCASSG